MFDKILKNEDIQELLKEIFNNPKYYNKEVEEVLKEEFFLHERVLIIFYDALYKYQLIIEDEKYLKEFVVGFEALIRKLEKIEDIKFGVTKLLGKLILKKLNIEQDELEENKKKILEYVYDKYIKNGYYIRGLSKVDYNLIKEIGVIRSIHLEYADYLSEVLQKYGLDIYDNYKEIEFNTDFSKASLKSINTPSYLYNLVVNNNYITANRECYYLKNKKLALKNLNILLKKLYVNSEDKNEVRELFNNIWDYFNDEKNNIYLVLIKRSKLKEVDDYIYNNEFTFEESLDNIFTAYDDFEALEEVTQEIDYLIELPSYKEFIKEKKEHVKQKIEIDNEYGKVSIIMIVGIVFIVLGVLISIILL